MRIPIRASQDRAGKSYTNPGPHPAREEIRSPERGRKWFRLALADKISLSSELPAVSFLV
jgi:hypothetical protein